MQAHGVGARHPVGGGDPGSVAGQDVQTAPGRENGDAGAVGGPRGAAGPVVLRPVGCRCDPDAVSAVDGAEVRGVGVEHLEGAEGQAPAGGVEGQVCGAGRVCTDDEQAYRHGLGA